MPRRRRNQAANDPIVDRKEDSFLQRFGDVDRGLLFGWMTNCMLPVFVIGHTPLFWTYWFLAAAVICFGLLILRVKLKLSFQTPFYPVKMF